MRDYGEILKEAQRLCDLAGIGQRDAVPVQIMRRAGFTWPMILQMKFDIWRHSNAA